MSAGSIICGISSSSSAIFNAKVKLVSASFLSVPNDVMQSVIKIAYSRQHKSAEVTWGSLLPTREDTGLLPPVAHDFMT